MPLRSSARFTEFSFYGLFLLTAVCVLVLCLIPRALAPTDTPVLILDRARTTQVVSADRGARAPDTLAARELDKRFLEFGALENNTLESGTTPAQLRHLLANGYQQVARDELMSPEHCAHDARVALDTVDELRRAVATHAHAKGGFEPAQ